MPSTYSPNLRIELVANGEQTGTWGSTTNNNLGTLIESAVSGHVSVPITGSAQALVALNGVNDQARNMVISLTQSNPLGPVPSGPFTVFVPPAEKVYIFRNVAGFTATISASTVPNGIDPTGGETISIPDGKTIAVFCDSANNIREASNYVASNLDVDGTITADQVVTNTPLAPNYGGTGFSAYTVGSLLVADTNTSLAALTPGPAGYSLKTQGTGNLPVWGKVNLATEVDGNLPVTNLNGGTGADNTKFWRGDGVWATPAGGGDVSGPASATDNAVPLFNGATGKSIKNSNITYNPTTNTLTVANFSGNGSALTNLNASNITSGSIPATTGGTGQTTYVTGDILYANSATTLARLAGGTANNGRYLTISGGVPAWATIPTSSGTVTSVAAGSGMSFTTITGSGSVTMGTPGSISTSSTNSVGTGTHTHALNTSGLALTSQFANSLGATGYQKFPGGLMIQWGYIAPTTAGGVTNVTFPQAFSAIYHVNAIQRRDGSTNGAGNDTVISAAPTTTGFSVSIAAGQTGMYWMAIGAA